VTLRAERDVFIMLKLCNVNWVLLLRNETLEAAF
jgi:hypothetical protein